MLQTRQNKLSSSAPFGKSQAPTSTQRGLCPVAPPQPQPRARPVPRRPSPARQGLARRSSALTPPWVAVPGLPQGPSPAPRAAAPQRDRRRRPGAERAPQPAPRPLCRRPSPAAAARRREAADRRGRPRRDATRSTAARLSRAQRPDAYPRSGGGGYGGCCCSSARPAGPRQAAARPPPRSRYSRSPGRGPRSGRPRCAPPPICGAWQGGAGGEEPPPRPAPARETPTAGAAPGKPRRPPGACAA